MWSGLKTAKEKGKKMDSEQIEYLTKDDPFLKKYANFIVFDHEIPSILPMNTIYFILLTNGQIKKTPEKQYDLGHWCILETLPYNNKSESKYGIGYFDPLGTPCNPLIRKKIVTTAKTYGLKVFINKTQVQLKIATVCGLFSTLVILLRARKYSYAEILGKKLSKSPRVNAMVVPDLISSLLPKTLKKLERFSIDFI